IWIGINMILQNAGAFFGMIVFTKLASRFGRKPIFAIGYICAMISTVAVFQFLNQRSDIFWMIPIMGFCQLSLFAGFAIYLPELFPVNLRSTGTSFCYNFALFLAPAGPLFLRNLLACMASGST